MIQHVTRTVSPAAAGQCVDFYRLLGFKRTRVPDSLDERAIWLALGPTQLHLMLREGARADEGHIAIVAPDYATTTGRLRAAGHDVVPRREHWGSPRSYVRDPVGNLVELMERAPS